MIHRGSMDEDRVECDSTPMDATATRMLQLRSDISAGRPEYLRTRAVNYLNYSLTCVLSFPFWKFIQAGNSNGSLYVGLRGCRIPIGAFITCGRMPTPPYQAPPRDTMTWRPRPERLL